MSYNGLTSYNGLSSTQDESVCAVCARQLLRRETECAALQRVCPVLSWVEREREERERLGAMRSTTTSGPQHPRHGRYALSSVFVCRRTALALFGFSQALLGPYALKSLCTGGHNGIVPKAVARSEVA